MHDIRAFSGGMKPPPWPGRRPEVTGWVEDASRFGADVMAGAIPVRDLPCIWRASILALRPSTPSSTATAAPGDYC